MLRPLQQLHFISFVKKRRGNGKFNSNKVEIQKQETV